MLPLTLMDRAPALAAEDELALLATLDEELIALLLELATLEVAAELLLEFTPPPTTLDALDALVTDDCELLALASDEEATLDAC